MRRRTTKAFLGLHEQQGAILSLQGLLDRLPEASGGMTNDGVHGEMALGPKDYLKTMVEPENRPGTVLTSVIPCFSRVPNVTTSTDRSVAASRRESKYASR